MGIWPYCPNIYAAPFNVNSAYLVNTVSGPEGCDVLPLELRYGCKIWKTR